MKIRKAVKGDETGLIELIKGLAEYENEPEAVINTPEQLANDLFEDNICEAFVAEDNDQLIGFALYYTSYSTWNGRCVYLEDLYVVPEFRRTGVGHKLFQKVVETAQKRKVKRLDWQVLDWNEPAIKFYEKLGATIDKEWYNGRIFFD